MTTRIVFIQGGGDGAHDADAVMVASLERELGEGYPIDFPRMPDEDGPDFERWRPVIREAIGRTADSVVVVGHSVGGYLLLKFLAEEQPALPVRAICILAAPFPSGDATWTIGGFELPDHFADLLPGGAPVFLYASQDDETVPYAHRDLYAGAIPGSLTRTTMGGHQVSDGLGVVADDIRANSRRS
jgi:predicted alpha/beta hydrolase family esterase